MLHHTRQLFIRQQTSVINAIQAHLAAFEIVAPVGRQGVEALLQVVADASDNRRPRRPAADPEGAVLEFDRRILAWHRSDATSWRLAA
jgi:transposase